MPVKRMSKSSRLSSQLIKVIESHDGSSTQRFPSVRQIALEHNVSIITANKVISNLVAQGYLVKREGVGTFVAPRGGSEGLTGKNDVALCLGPTTFSVFFFGLFAGLTNQARLMGLNMSVYSDASPVEGRVREFIKQALEAGFRSLLVGFLNRADILGVEDLLRSADNVVVFGNEEELEFASSGIDVARGACLGGKFFGRMGHRDILFMRPHLPSRERGFLKGLAEEGVELPPHLMIPSDGTERSGYDIVNQAILSGVKFTGVMTCSDESTLGALFALRGHGLKVPDDVSIISFGDTGPIRAICPVTSISVRPEELARQTLEMMSERIEGRSREVAHRWVEPMLIDRGSVRHLGLASE